LITILFSLTIHTLRSARSCVSRIVQTTACKRSLLLLVRLHSTFSFSSSPLDPFTSPRRLCSCPFRAGSGLPCLWVRFPHSPCCTRSSPLSPSSYIFISCHLHLPIDKSKYLLHTLSSSAYSMCVSHPCFSFVYLCVSLIYRYFSFSSLI
jgi:hypothetical protein